jgi:hypothetical protein
VYASLDRGASWTKLGANLPSVPVYDLKVHPRDGDLIASTHGRGIWIADITPLQQTTSKVMASAVHLYAPRTAFQWGEGPTLNSGGNGNAMFHMQFPSPSYGAEVRYRVTAAGAAGTASIKISDATGETIATLTGPGTAGLHTVTWNFSGQRAVVATPAALSASERRDSILKAVRAPQVLDSLTKAKYDTTAIARAKTLLTPVTLPAGGRGGRGGGGGGGGGRGAGANCWQPLTQWETYCARPGEGQAGGGGGGGGGGRGAAIAESDAVKKIFSIIGIPVPSPFGGGGRGGFGGFGGGGAGSFTAGTGDYLVTLTIGTTTLKQKLHVERVSGGDDNGSPFGGDDDEDRDGKH